jgi:electron transport complex protein RnfB
MMHTIIVEECTGCELCIAPCPVDCITMAPAADPENDPAESDAMSHAAQFRGRYVAHVARLQRWELQREAELTARKARVDAGGDAVNAAIARARAKKSAGGA